MHAVKVTQIGFQWTVRHSHLLSILLNGRHNFNRDKSLGAAFLQDESRNNECIMEFNCHNQLLALCQALSRVDEFMVWQNDSGVFFHTTYAPSLIYIMNRAYATWFALFFIRSSIF